VSRHPGRQNDGMSLPVTVSVTRHVDPTRSSEMLAWVRAGTSLAERFDGFLGSGWVRPSTSSPEWHMLYRFADTTSLDAWEGSPQRAWWLEAAQGRIESRRVERRTGIEGWFDEPSSVETVERATTPPPRWKQAVVIWLAFFPLSLVVTWLTGSFTDLPLVPRVLLSTVVMTPVMTYVVLPRMTTALAWWLAGDPPPWRT
jgi:antibiotic biosynthesis monooxygenase (ABM) superfamily enzyme